MNTRQVFEALPHIDTIWVVGENFHLHPNYGGEKVERFPATEVVESQVETIAPTKKVRVKKEK